MAILGDRPPRGHRRVLVCKLLQRELLGGLPIDAVLLRDLSQVPLYHKGLGRVHRQLFPHPFVDAVVHVVDGILHEGGAVLLPELVPNVLQLCDLRLIRSPAQRAHGLAKVLGALGSGRDEAHALHQQLAKQYQNLIRFDGQIFAHNGLHADARLLFFILL
eukprot:scaffold904_cov239-Pinguiococcus_pyrenoidosus.AAC.13